MPELLSPGGLGSFALLSTRVIQRLLSFSTDVPRMLMAMPRKTHLSSGAPGLSPAVCPGSYAAASSASPHTASSASAAVSGCFRAHQSASA